MLIIVLRILDNKEQRRLVKSLAETVPVGEDVGMYVFMKTKILFYIFIFQYLLNKYLFLFLHRNSVILERLKVS